MYGIYLKYENGQEERLGLELSGGNKSYYEWEDKISARRWADLIEKDKDARHIVSVTVKECK